MVHIGKERYADKMQSLFFYFTANFGQHTFDKEDNQNAVRKVKNLSMSGIAYKTHKHISAFWFT